MDELRVIANTVFTFQIKTHAHVDAAMTKMTVECATITVFVHQLADVAQISAQFFRSDSGVIPSFPLRGSSRCKGCCSRTGFTNLPDMFGFFRGVNARTRWLRELVYAS